MPATSELHVSLGRELDRAGRDDVHVLYMHYDLERMMPAMHSGASCGSIPSQIVTWVQIMETLAAAASAPVFMRLPETQLQCQGRQVMAAMSVSPIVPEGWKYSRCNLPECEHCAIQGVPTRTIMLAFAYSPGYHDHVYVDTLLAL